MNVKSEAIIGSERLAPGPWKTPDPFLFCMYHVDGYPAGNEAMGPSASLEGRAIGQDFSSKDGWSMYHGREVPGFPEHPHAGFETVTLVRRGFIDHADSLGAAARYGEGDVQWLTAGKGVRHAEMFPLVHRDRENPTELFQLWLNLPKRSKGATPAFSMFWHEAIPVHVEEDEEGRRIEIKLIAGELGEKRALAPPPDSWAARKDADLAIWTLRLAPGARWTLPPAAAGSNRSLYFFSGPSLRVEGRELSEPHRLDLVAEREVAIEAGPEAVELLLLQGRPIAEPVVQYGPFVAESPEALRITMMRYQATQFGGWPWESHEPVHPRAEGRFARLPDGSVDRPDLSSS